MWYRELCDPKMGGAQADSHECEPEGATAGASASGLERQGCRHPGLLAVGLRDSVNSTQLRQAPLSLAPCIPVRYATVNMMSSLTLLPPYALEEEPGTGPGQEGIPHLPSFEGSSVDHRAKGPKQALGPPFAVPRKGLL